MYSKPEHTSDVHDGRPVPGCGACIWEQAVEATLDCVEQQVARRGSTERYLVAVYREVRERVK